MPENQNKDDELDLNIDDSALKQELELLETDIDQLKNETQEDTNEIKEATPHPPEEPIQVAQKSNKIKYILIGLGGVVIITATAIGLYFGGIFGEIDENQTKTTQQSVDTNVTKKPKYKFEIDHINPDRLNRKLALLSKHELSSEQIRELLASGDTNETVIYDKEMLQLVALEEPLKDINLSLDKNTSEMKAKVVLNETNGTKEMTKVTQKEKPKKVEKKLDDKKKLIYVQFAYLKYTNYKLATQELKNINAKFSVCKDKQATKIIIGPLKNNEEKRKLIKSIIEKTSTKDPFGIEMTEAQFDKMCSF